MFKYHMTPQRGSEFFLKPSECRHMGEGKFCQIVI